MSPPSPASGGHPPPEVLARALEAPRTSGARLRLALEASQQRLWEWDLATDQLSFFPGGHPLLGPGSLSLAGWGARIHSDERTRVLAGLERLRSGQEESWTATYRLGGPAGGYRWYLSQGQVVARDGQGRPLRAAGATLDINARQLAGEALDAGGNRFQAAFEQAAAGIATVDLAGRFLKANQRMGALLGLPAEELVGKAFREFTPAEEWAADWEGSRRLLAGDISVYARDKRYLCQTGGTAWGHLSVSLVRDGDGTPRHFTVMIEDFGLRKECEERFTRTRAELAAILAALPILYLRMDAKGRLLGKLAGRPMGGALPSRMRVGRTPAEALPAPAGPGLLAAGLRVHQEGRPRDLAFSLAEEDGPHHYAATLAPVLGDQVVAVVRDITARKRSEESQRMAAKVLENSADGVMLADREGRVTLVNPACERITGHAAGEILGQPLDIFRADHLPAKLYEAIWRGLTERGQWSGEYLNRRQSGEAYPEWLTLSLLKDEQGRPANYLAVFHDLTEIKRDQAEVVYKAHHDALTGLPNRHLLGDRLNQALAHAGREKRKVGVIFLDLDRFKRVNDRLGHRVGDVLLQEVARRLQRCVRREDTVARLGGDEFVLLALSLKDAAGLARLARRVRRAMMAPFLLAGHSIQLGASQGLALYPDDGPDLESLLKNADLAMYRAKELGGGYQLYAPALHLAANQRLEMESDLRRALRRGEFAVFYQPILAEPDGRLLGLEALVRWRSPQRGVLAPAEFLSLAEESGLILPLGGWVMEQACRLAGRLHQAGHAGLRVAVNLSAAELAHPNLKHRVATILARAQFPAAGLNLEVAAADLRQGDEQAFANLAALAGLGVGLVLDRFGEGHLALERLAGLPWRALKLDRARVAGLPAAPHPCRLARAAIALARGLGIAALAVGVETAPQRDFLCAEGCDGMQGFLFTPPLAEAEFLAWLKERERGGRPAGG